VFPSSFDYVLAESVDHAVAVKAEGGDDTRVLAGGQSLIPMMKTRLAAPAQPVDINRVPGLAVLNKGRRAEVRSPASAKSKARLPSSQP
jgi:CO/xanthine dehydrogenase FAD-binding subunit